MSARLSHAGILADIAACLRFYTRLPVPDLPERSFAAAQWAAPVAGIVVGVVVGFVLWLAVFCGMPATLAAAFALAAGVALTGALHEDGLADTVDGFGGGRTRERKLEIMRDSRIGTYGALALMLSLLMRWASLAALASLAPPVMVVTVVVAHAASRALIPAFLLRLPPARVDGLSAQAGRAGASTAVAAVAIGLVVALLPGAGFLLLAVILLAGVFLSVERLALRQIGGHTGDVVGALQQAGEIVLLALAASVLS